MSGPGRQIGSGRLRVDAGRAVSKLREYQLPDPQLWPLEVVRGAIALGATRIRAFGDADDVWVCWGGPTPSIDALRTVLNELVSPGADVDRRGLRLLAIGVNTALGLRPRWLDLYAVSASGTQKVRYTAELLDPKALGEDGITSRAPQAASPAQLPFDTGGAVHFRRFPGFQALGLLLRGARPPELELLRGAARDLSVPATVCDEEITPGANPRDLVKVDLGLGLNGFVALRSGSPHVHGVALDFAELGVLLTQHVMQQGQLHGPPLRLFLDAARLPTNASRSAVRLDESPVRDAIARLPDVMPGLVDAIVDRCADGADETLRFAVARLIAAFVSGRDWQHRLDQVPAVYQPLLDLPILRNALGEWRTARQFEPALAIVHREELPVPEVLRPWFHNILWVRPGSAEENLLGTWEAPPAVEYGAQAKENLEAWRRWAEQKPREPRVPYIPKQWVSVEVGESTEHTGTSVPLGPLQQAGVLGEVCVFRLLPEQRPLGRITILLDGRPLTEVTVNSPLQFHAVLEVPAIQPAPDYESVVQDEVFDAAVATARAGAIRAVELLASKVVDPKRTLPKSCTIRDPDSIHGFEAMDLIRSAQVGLVAFALGSAPDPESIPELFKRGALGKVPSWPATDREGTIRGVPLRSMLSGLVPGKKRVLLVCDPHRPGAPAGRDVFLLDARNRSRLRVLLGQPTIVTYEPTRGSTTAAALMVKQLKFADFVGLEIEEESRRGIVFDDAQPILRRLHGGEFVAHGTHAYAVAPVSIIVDDDGITPGKGTVALEAKQPFAPRDWEIKWLRAVIDRLAGMEVPELTVHGHLEHMRNLHREVLLAAARPKVRGMLGRERFDRLRDLPIVPRVGAEPCSLAFARTEEAIEFLRPAEVAPLDLAEWHPLAVDDELARAIGALTGRRVEHAVDELERRRRLAVRRAAIAAHRSRAEREMPAVGADSVELGGKIKGVVSLGRTADARVYVWIERRPFAHFVLEHGSPVHAIVDVPSSYANEAFGAITAESTKKIGGVVRRAITRLLLRIARETPERLADEAAPAQLLLEWLRRTGSHRGARKARAELAALPIFRSVHGGRCSILEASTKSRVRVGEYEGEWVGPAEGEDDHLLDGPVLSLPKGAGFVALKTAFETLGAPRKVLDHTRALRELQAERLVQQNLVPTPTLPAIDARLRAPLKELESHRRFRILGAGEIGLVETGPSKLVVFGNGMRAGETELDVTPSVHLAVESLALANAFHEKKQIPRRIEPQMRILLKHLFERKVLAELQLLPHWVTQAARQAATDGLFEWSKLTGDVIQTTAGEWVSLDVMRQQEARWGDVWFTPATSDIERSRLPLEPERLAFRLSLVEAESLASEFELFEAAQELRFDETTRQNQNRPKAKNLNLPESLQGHLLAEFEIKHGDAEIRLGVLPASHAAYAGVHLYRDMRKIRVRKIRGWPVIAKVNDPKLKPNRVWDDVEDDDVVRKLFARIRNRADALLEELLQAPKTALVAFRPQASIIRTEFEIGESVAGVFWLDRTIDQGSVQLHAKYTSDLRAWNPRGRLIPMHGEVHAVLEGHVNVGERLDPLLRRAYSELAERLAARCESLEGAELDITLAHLVVAVTSTYWEPSKKALALELPCFHPEPWTLGQLADAIVGSEDFDVMDASQVRADQVALLRDDTETARAAEEALGRRIRTARVRSRIDTGEHVVPFAALGARLLEMLGRINLGHAVREIVIDSDRKKGVLRYSRSLLELSLAGSHPSIIALEEARLRRTVDAERGIVVLAAHAAGLIQRGLKAPASSHASVMLALLRDEDST